MIWRKGILVITCFLLLITVASALIADSGQMSIIGPDWIVANTFDNTTISVRATNMSSGGLGVAAVPVNFFVEDVLYGNVSPSNAVTDGLGYATTTFTANKTSGIAFFHAVVPLSVGGAPILQDYSGWINVDHGPAYSASLDYQGEVIVDQTTPFVLTLKDRYRNRVDNKNPAYVHTVKFIMYLPPGGLGTGGLKNATSAYLTTIYDSTDNKGNISLTAKVDTVPGENNIRISPIENMPNPLYPYILGITQAPPFYIEQEFSPDNPPSLKADQVSSFSIQYTLFDKFRNPAGSQTLHIFTSENEDLGNITSNSLGQIGITYGPRSTTGTVNITAVAVANASVHCSKTVEFLSTDPVSMVVTANPQMIPSRDVPTDPPVTAEIIAKIMDIMGNPVEGETVSFTLTGYTNSTILTTRPSFSSSTYLTTQSNTTDPDGNAVVTFYAGEFPMSGPYYNSTATGTATILAAWKGKTMPITITFKNYPYLRVETSVTPPTVNVSATIDVDIRLIGDGWKLTQKDIDTVLVFDKSGSMGWDTPTRISQAQAATNAFVDEMGARDQIGLVKFSDSTSLDQQLTLDHTAVKNKINALTAEGSTQERTGLYTGISELLTTRARAGAVKAVILMTDGDWNNEGTPLGHGTGYPANNTCGYTFSGSSLEPNNYRWYDIPTDKGTLTSYWSDACWATKLRCTNGEFTNQNMSRYAKTNNIRLYTISFAATLDPTAVQALQIMANNTGGFYQHAPTGDQLKEIYKKIAGDLREYAGVNTQMNLSFQNVNVTYNNVTSYMSGKDVFEYIYSSGASTWVTSWNKTQDPLQDQVPKPTNPDVLPNFGTYTTYPYSFNQRDEWLSTSGLKFNAGNITINQTWETKFRFRVNATGNIDIFGPGSKIIFNNGESELELPHTYVSAVQNLTNVGLVATDLDIYNLHSTGSTVTNDYIPLSWQINYGGNDTVTEEISWQKEGTNIWKMFDLRKIGNDTLTDYSILDVRTFEPGTYYIRVKASAPDAADDYEYLLAPGFTVGTAGLIYIKLE